MAEKQDDTSETDGRRRELLALERAFWDAMKERDGAKAARLTDQRCIVIGPQGISEIGPEALAAMVASAPYELDTYGLEEQGVRVRFLAADVALVAYPVQERLTVDGEANDLRAFDASVWIRRGDGWVCALHTETLAGDPFGRDRAAAARA